MNRTVGLINWEWPMDDFDWVNRENGNLVVLYIRVSVIIARIVEYIELGTKSLVIEQTKFCLKKCTTT